MPCVIALAHIVFSNSSSVNPSRLRIGGTRKSEDIHITKQHLFAQNISEMCLVAFKDGCLLNCPLKFMERAIVGLSGKSQVANFSAVRD